MSCPDSRHGRLESVVTLQGRKAMTTRMHAFLMTLIDGQRTLKDMATVLEEQQLMPRQEAETALRGFLIRIYDEAQRGGRRTG